MAKVFCVYILASDYNGTLYIGMTADLQKRMYQHKQKMLEGFSKRYSIDKLVYFETHETPLGAITREKQMKKWRREWKIRLIEEKNSSWADLYDTIKC